MAADEKKRRVTYFYQPSIENYNYGEDHAMKPSRITMTDDIVRFHGLHNHMNVVQPVRATPEQIMNFHSKDYVNFLKSVSPEIVADWKNAKKFKKFQFPSEDCPYFEGVYEFSQVSAGGSIGAALALNDKSADIAINWAGGLHHAMMTHASGFCYVNDIVLGILELLKVHNRVLYVDVDIHHGDGVEEAFYTTDRVMTVSFHKYAKGFFPRTGHFEDIGHGDGTGYSLNVPLDDGIDDNSFVGLFEPVMQKVMDVYQPDAVVLQCGADSLFGDLLGTFNLSIKGHSFCLEFLRKFNVPMMVLGGGGYSVENVAKCWSYETSVAVGIHIESDLTLSPCSRNEAFANKNRERHLEDLRYQLIDRVSRLPNSPSTQFQMVTPHTKVPEEAEDPMEEGRSKTRMMSAVQDDRDDDE